MKYRPELSIEWEKRRGQWKSIVCSRDLHIAKRGLMVFAENYASDIRNAPKKDDAKVTLRLVINETEWTLPDGQFHDTYSIDFVDRMDNIFREIERVIDLHIAFYED